MKSPYRQALDYLYSFTDYEKQSGFPYSPDRFDLRRVERLLSLLGNPHHAFQAIHVAGTKGKGSTAAMIASILHAAGHRTALYTSPHLHTFRERIQIDGQLISEEQVVDGVNRLREVVPQVPGLTTFELITALAFSYFARSFQGPGREPALAAIEVGLGGRLDATNVVDPLVSIITSISYDHMVYLGDTLAAIAAEKAGIIKPGVPVISAPQFPEALETVERIAGDRGSALTLVGRDWQWENVAASAEGQRFAVWPSSAPASRATYWLPLLGRHQQVNAATAVAAVAQLRRQGVDVPGTAIEAGLRSVRWPGRLEVLGRRPWVIVDGAHNGDSMQKLRDALGELFPHRRTVLVFGASAGKDLDRMFDVILPAVDHVLVTRAHHPRAAEPEALSKRMAAYGKEVTTVPVGQVLEAALHLAQEQDLICATGSLFVVADFRLAWLRHEQGPLPPTDPE